MVCFEHTKHDQPLRVLDTVLVGLRVTKRGNLDVVGFIDLVLGTVTDEDGLATPLDDNLLNTRGLISPLPQIQPLPHPSPKKTQSKD